MSSNDNSRGGSVSFASLLTILFIGLKLTGYIDWSWWWVLSPLWITGGILIGILGIVCVVMLAAESQKKKK